MVWNAGTTPARTGRPGGAGWPAGTVRHAGCFLNGDNPRKDSTMRLMQQTFLMTDIRKRVALLSLLSFLALC